MEPQEDWQMLLHTAGVGNPEILKRATDSSPVHPFNLPLELRLEIYAHLLAGHINPLCHVWSSHLYVKLRRPPDLANLLLTCRAFYLDAVRIPFNVQTFEVVFWQGAFSYIPEHEHENGIILDESNGLRVLRMPLHMRIWPRLNHTTDMIAPLLYLQRVLNIRQDHRRKTEVQLSLSKVSTGKKLAVLRSLRKFLAGLKCDVLVSEIEDIREEWDTASEDSWIKDLQVWVHEFFGRSQDANTSQH